MGRALQYEYRDLDVSTALHCVHCIYVYVNSRRQIPLLLQRCMTVSDQRHVCVWTGVVPLQGLQTPRVNTTCTTELQISYCYGHYNTMGNILRVGSRSSRLHAPPPSYLFANSPEL